METKILNFKKVEVTGRSKEEALGKAPFGIQGDATQAYKKWKSEQTRAITDKEIKEFCLEYLQKKSKSLPGVGFSITLESAVADTRERPYKFNDVKNEKGKRKYLTTYELIDAETGKVLRKTTETKAKAKELAKKLYIDEKFTGKIVCKYTKQVAEGEPIAFEVSYAPSASSKIGTYLVFGIEA